MGKTYYIDNSSKVSQDFLPEGIVCLSPADYLTKERDEKDQLVVLCEIDINAQNQVVNRTDFYGISFVQELRRYNYKNKVLFVSFLPESYYKEKVLNAQILFFPGHSFLQLPVSPTEWLYRFETFESLTELSLYDAKHHYCSIDQIVDEKFHSLTPLFKASKQLTPELIEKGESLVKFVFNSLNKKLPDLQNILNDELSGPEALRGLKSISESVLPITNASTQEQLRPEWKYWKVLWLDDEESMHSPLYKKLVKSLGSEEKVILCKSYEEALLAWEQDKGHGEISYILCDYRLKTHHNLPAKKQGYDFMQFIAGEGRNVGKVVYSGLKRKFLIESFRHYGIRVNIYSKIDFNQYKNEDLEFLTDELIRLGDEHWIEINNAPQAQEWHIMSPTYYNFKNSFGFHSFDNHISLLAKQNLEHFFEEYNSVQNEQKLWELATTDSFVVRSSKFPNSKKKQEQAIRDILITRRMAIGLYAFLLSDKNTHKDLIPVDRFRLYLHTVLVNSSSNLEKSTDSVFKAISSNNALSFDTTWPLGLLPEEFGWLKFDMRLVEETNEEIHSYLRQLQVIKKNFQTLFSEQPFSDSIAQQDMKVSAGSGRDIVFTDNFLPLIRNASQAKVLLKNAYIHFKLADKNAYRVFIGLWRALIAQLAKGDFKSSGLLSDFLYFVTKTLKAEKFNFDVYRERLVADNSDRIKQVLHQISSVASEVSQRNEEVESTSIKVLKKAMDLGDLPSHIKASITVLIRQMLDSEKTKQLTALVESVTEKIENQEFSVAQQKIYEYVNIGNAYTVEQEFMLNHAPWEVIFPKQQRIKQDFFEKSNQLFQAIKNKDYDFTLPGLANSDDIFSNALYDMIEIYHKSNSHSYIDIYLRGLKYTRERANIYRQHYGNLEGSLSNNTTNEQSSLHIAENQLARESYYETPEDFSDLFTEESNSSTYYDLDNLIDPDSY